jgi:hypothetical protein
MKRGRVVAALLVAVLAIPGVALAAWRASGDGSGRARADAIGSTGAPTVSATGRAVSVSWTAATLGGGAAADGYTVRRYADGSGTPETISSACTGTIAGLTCTESLVPAGSWRYTVTPVFGPWTGPESATSAIVSMAAPSFAFSSSATITALPAVKAGSLAQFGAGETVEFRLGSPTGTPLTGGTTPATIGAAGTATTSTTIPAGTSDGVHAVYAVGSLGSEASASLTIDRTAPAIGAAVIQKTLGGVPGYLRQGRTYRVFANVTDAVSTVATVTADVSTVTTGSTAVTLTTTGGPWTVGGVSYGYRSASVTANGTLAAGAKAFTVTATDSAGNSATTGGFSVTIDNTVPAASGISASNDSGGTVGRAETGDSIVYTYTEPIDPNSIIASWDGTATTVTLRLINAGGGDRVQIWNAANTAQLPLGVVRLGGTGYTASTVNFTGSTMTMSGSSITVVLGTPSGAVSTAVVASTMRWIPSATATDWAGNACSTTALNEPPALDPEF